MTTRMQASARRAAQLLAALAEPEGRADPYPLYDQLRALGPVVAAPDGVLVVTGYRACSALLRDRRLRKAPERALAAAGYRDWRDRPSLRLLYTSIMMLDPSAHARLRRLVSAIFTARRVQGLRPAVEQIVAQAPSSTGDPEDLRYPLLRAGPAGHPSRVAGQPAAARTPPPCSSRVMTRPAPAAAGTTQADRQA